MKTYSLAIKKTCRFHYRSEQKSTYDLSGLHEPEHCAGNGRKGERNTVSGKIGTYRQSSKKGWRLRRRWRGMWCPSPRFLEKGLEKIEGGTINWWDEKKPGIEQSKKRRAKVTIDEVESKTSQWGDEELWRVNKLECHSRRGSRERMLMQM